MINLLLGPPGGGKSYEAVVFHILPALAAGRKVITNLPLNMDRLRAIDASYPLLVQRVTDRVGVVQQQTLRAGAFRPVRLVDSGVPGVIRAFSTMEDFGDPWRHPTDGSGPFYVIDECHLAFPAKGTSLAVEEWFSMIRHESADALLITQSYAKMSQTIVHLVQVCYRVRKATAFGSAGRYIRKVQDGVRGEVVNTSIRKYEKRYFGLYESHTKGGGSELVPEDITPIWKRWPFIGAAVMLPLAAFIFIGSGSPNILRVPAADIKKQPVPLAGVDAPLSTQPHVQTKPDGPKLGAWGAGGVHPLSGRTLHVVGFLQAAKAKVYEFAVAQNGQRVMGITGAELVALGYRVDVAAGQPCAVKVGFEAWDTWVICDAPTVAIQAPSGPSTTSSAPVAAADHQGPQTVQASKAGQST
jgi:zona occludens toxin